MPGGAIKFQNLWAHSVTHSNTRGWAPSPTTLRFYVSNFPEGFDFQTPPAQFAYPDSVEPPDVAGALAVARGSATTSAPQLGQQRSLRWAGSLTIAYVDREGREHVRTASPLFVMSVEQVRNTEGVIDEVVVRCLDARVLWPGRGVLGRWSYNRLRPDGSYAVDSLRQDGTPHSTLDVVRDAVASLPGAPRLVQPYPEAWLGARSWEFEAFDQATNALALVGKETQADPCLNVGDGSTVSFFALGEGGVGQAQRGQGGNPTPLPAYAYRSARPGEEPSHRIEATYGYGHVLVVGGLRVATVAIDHAEPVLVDSQGNVRTLDERLVRELTDGRRGLDWLRAFVMQPGESQNIPGLREEVAELFAEQAWRLYRIPGVEVEVEELDGPDGERSGRFSKQPGPNARLLPVLDRAEQSAGKRLGATAESFRWKVVRESFAGSVTEEELQAREVLQALSTLRRAIQAEAARIAEPDPWGSDIQFGRNEEQLTQETIAGLVNDRAGLFVTHEEFQEFLRRARLLNRIRSSVGDQYAEPYAKRLDTLFKLQEVVAEPGYSALWALARQIADLERTLNERRNISEDVDEELDESPNLREQIVSQVISTVREVRSQREEAANRSRVGAVTGNVAQIARLSNLDRSVDSGARVYDASKGLFLLSSLAGHAERVDVPSPRSTVFVPRPVRLLFGAVLRPRTDVPLLDGRAGLTGAVGTLGPTTATPLPITDRESRYVACFRNEGGLPVRVDLEALDPDSRAKILRDAHRVNRPDLVELVPLEGPSNRTELDRQALELARGEFKLPADVRANTQTLHHPWNVNCDGVVSGVVVATASTGVGFVTQIFTGGDPVEVNPMQTRVRPRAQRSPDGAAREGVNP